MKILNSEYWIVYIQANSAEAKGELSEYAAKNTEEATLLKPFILIKAFAGDKEAAKKFAYQWDIKNKKQFGSNQMPYRITVIDILANVIREQ